MVNVTFTWGRVGDGPRRITTVYDALKEKLDREPTHVELKADVERILSEATRERAERGKLAHQRRR